MHCDSSAELGLCNQLVKQYSMSNAQLERIEM